MAITLTGKNDYALRRRLGVLMSSFEAEYGELAVERVDAQETDSEAIIGGLHSLPFLVQKKLVVVRNGSLNKQFAEAIEQIISSISESTETVFYEPQIDKRTAYFKVLKSQTQFEEFSELDPASLAKWLIDVAKNDGGQMSLADASYLVDRVGTNQSLLSNELDKLLAYSPEISHQNIDLLTEPAPSGKIFDLLDAAFGGNKARALKLYEDRRAQKMEPQAILAMIAWQLQQIAVAKMAGIRSMAEVSQDSGMKEYPLSKAKNLADKLSDNKLKQMVSEALDIDWRSKTTGLDLDEALKTYIISL